MVAAFSKSSAPQIRAAGRWLEKKTADEVLKRYFDTIRVAVGKAQASGERERAEASAYPHARGIAWGVNTDGGFILLRNLRRPDGTDEAEG